MRAVAASRERFGIVGIGHAFLKCVQCVFVLLFQREKNAEIVQSGGQERRGVVFPRRRRCLLEIVRCLGKLPERQVRSSQMPEQGGLHKRITAFLRQRERQFERLERLFGLSQCHCGLRGEDERLDLRRTVADRFYKICGLLPMGQCLAEGSPLKSLTPCFTRESPGDDV